MLKYSDLESLIQESNLDRSEWTLGNGGLRLTILVILIVSVTHPPHLAHSQSYPPCEERKCEESEEKNVEVLHRVFQFDHLPYRPLWAVARATCR